MYVSGKVEKEEWKKWKEKISFQAVAFCFVCSATLLFTYQKYQEQPTLVVILEKWKKKKGRLEGKEVLPNGGRSMTHWRWQLQVYSPKLFSCPIEKQDDDNNNTIKV